MLKRTVSACVIVLCLSLTSVVFSGSPFSTASPTDCTPANQERLRCELYLQSSYCDNITSISRADPLTHTRIDVSQLVSTAHYIHQELNGYSISLQSSWHITEDLNGVEGFILKYFIKEGATLSEQLCAYLRVWTDSTKPLITDVPVVFDIQLTDQLPAASAVNGSWYTELYTIPFITSGSGATDISPALTAEFQPAAATSLNPLSSTATPSPTTPRPGKFDMNLTLTSDKPYEVRIRFRRSSSDPYWDSRYRHVNYKVSLDNEDDTWGTFINGSRIPGIIVDRTTDDVYADVLLQDIFPGRKYIYVYPQKKETNCVEPYCRIIYDGYNKVGDFFNIGGRDYVPDIEPRLEQRSSHRLDVTFSMAPANWYFTSYDVELYSVSHTPDTVPHLLLTRRIPYQERSSHWVSHTEKIGLSELSINLGDNTALFVMVSPVMKEVICKKAAYCNIYGFCKKCSQSDSNLIYYQLSMGTISPAGGPALEFFGLTPLPVVLVTMAIICLLYRYNDCFREALNGLKNKYTNSRSPPNDPARSIEEEFSLWTEMSGPGLVIYEAPKKKLILAYYSSESMYPNLCKILKESLEKFCNCDVYVYTGEADERHNLNSASKVLVLCSKDLYELYKKLNDKTPRGLNRDEQDGKRVLDILSPSNTELRLEPESQHIAVVTFDQIPDYVSNRLAAVHTRTARDVISLPSELQQLACFVEGAPGIKYREAQFNMWSDYQRHHLHAELLDLLKMSSFDSPTTTSPDSGLGTLPYQSAPDSHLTSSNPTDYHSELLFSHSLPGVSIDPFNRTNVEDNVRRSLNSASCQHNGRQTGQNSQKDKSNTSASLSELESLSESYLSI